MDEPAKNLCRDVCAERVRRVMNGYTNAKGETVAGLGGDFAYLRTRRIPAGRLLEIEHEQVWTALQLAHFDRLAPWPESETSFLRVREKADMLESCPRFLWAGDEDEAVCYVPRFRREDAPALRNAMKRSAAVALYSWQPQALRQHVRAGHVSHLPIPETLARRFGLHHGGQP